MEHPQPSPDSLRRLFGEDTVETFKHELADVLTSDEYADLRQEAGRHLRTLPWPGAVKQIAQEAAVLLDTPMAPALKKIYGSANLLHRYLDRDQYDPQEIVKVELAAHEINSHYEPRLEVVINGHAMPALKLDVDVVLELKGLVLTIQDARIKEITPGTGMGRGTIAFHGHVLAEQETATLTLPPIDLGDGLPIAP